MEAELGKWLTELNQRIRKGCTGHLNSEGRLYYMNHETKVSSWLPPVESWDSGGTGLPYGWEAAVDKEGKTYFINHVNKTTTYEDPRKDVDEEPPQPREVELIRDPQMGFGFVAGSEKPVIVRFVTEGGPSENKLLPGDQILKINGEDVMKAPREHAIDLVRSCKHSVILTVCQPHTSNTTRKSALLTAAKKAKLKNNPSRVRFAEGVVINGSPLYSPSPLDSCVPFMPNVLKVFLENGQTKSFKYDSTTTVQDVLNSLQEKLSIKCLDHFSLVVEHIKVARRNRLTLLDPKDTLAKIAARPGAHHLRCLFRVTFVPKDAYNLLQKDPVAFEYLYVQCCNDMVQERFAPELKYDIALRLAALHIQQHALSSGLQGKLTIKAVERECGLDRFVPLSLLETMKRKELRKLLSHFLKQNQALCSPGQKQLTALQAKLHYLKIISELPSYGAKCFSTNLKDSSPETALLISPKFGISQITCLRNTIPLTLAQIEEISYIQVNKEDELSYSVELFLKDPDKESLIFSVEDRDAEELVLLLRGYHRLLAGRDLPIQWEAEDPWRTETVLCYHNRHTVQESPWSYPPISGGPGLRVVDLAVPPPPYVPCEHQERQLSRSSSRDQFILPISSSSSVDHNMNETQFITGASHSELPGVKLSHTEQVSKKDDLLRDDSKGTSLLCGEERNRGIDYQSVISMELLEDRAEDIDVDLYEAKNDEVIRRISEMNRIVIDAENYLCDDREESEQGGERDVSEDTEGMEPQPQLKAADSLLLLTQIDGDEELCSHTIEQKTPVVLDEEISPSESDTDSTPNDSPLHRSTPIRNSLNSHPRVRRDSSFGLHSPDLLPGIDSTSHNIMDILRQLQSNQLQLPFAEGTLYLDPDIIDLTMIPPPITPDVEVRDVPTTLNLPPTPFLDTNALHKELEKWARVSGRIEEEPEDLGECKEAWELENTEKKGIGDSDDSVKCERRTVDSARVVAELDHLCDALSELQASSLAQSLPQSMPVTLETLPVTEDIDTFIASVTVPPPPTGSKNERIVSNSFHEDPDDISAYIIPPPPSSSPSTEVQNEVIARFRQASEDMRRMIDDKEACSDGNCGEEDLMVTPLSEVGNMEMQRCWTLDSYSRLSTDNSSKIGSNPLLQETFQVIDNLNTAIDSEFHGDSSGYDTLTSSLTSYGETLINDEIDDHTYLSVEEEIHCYDSEFGGEHHSGTGTMPKYKNVTTGLHMWTSLPSSSSLPVPHTQTSCIDTVSPLSITSPSSTTSSDSISSIVLLGGTSSNGVNQQKPQAPPRVKKLPSPSGENGTHVRENGVVHGGSYDDLSITTAYQTSSVVHSPHIARSMSWTSMTDAESPLLVRKSNGHPSVKTQKPPLPPTSPFLQNRLRRSFSRGSQSSPGAPKKSDLYARGGGGLKSPVMKHHGNAGGFHSYSLGRTPPFQRKNTEKVPPSGLPRVVNGVSGGLSTTPLNGDGGSVTYPPFHSNFPGERHCGNDIELSGLTNGCINGEVLSTSSSSPIMMRPLTTNSPKITSLLNNSYVESNGSVPESVGNSFENSEGTECNGPFYQAQREISAMVLHLKTLGQKLPKSTNDAEIDIDKFIAAKDALIAESRQFVTASKLFVKSAMESSDKMVENMTSCLTLLDRIFTVSELVVMHMSSDLQVSALVERLKGVALAYSHTADAAKRAVGRGITNPHMGVLMHQATTLATALTSLMRTLRSLTAV